MISSAVGSGLDFEAGAPQDKSERLDDVRFILDDEYALLRH
jgi:hypothetical protein